MITTDVIVAKCPVCECRQEVLDGYLMRCIECGRDFRYFRKKNQAILRVHKWIDENGEYEDFIPKKIEQIEN